jgi:perosamine synthetase
MLSEFYRELGFSGGVPLHEPWFAGREWEYTKNCLDTGWVSSVGSYVDEFENDIAIISKTTNAVATVNGTAALHVSLVALGVRPGDLVICPALSFVGTANAISHCGADPYFFDIDEKTLGLNPIDLESFFNSDCYSNSRGLYHRGSDRRISACIPVHVLGHPPDMDPILESCRAVGVPVVEDAAEAIGSTYKGRPCGSIGNAGILSFNGNKTLTTGGGGVVITNDHKLAKKLKHLTTTAKLPHAWQFKHDAVGYNYRMPNINAAIGCAQLERLEYTLSLKRKLASKYEELFQNTPSVEVFRDQDWAQSNKWLNAILLKNQNERDDFLNKTNANHIQTRPCWDLLADLPMYRKSPRFGNLSCAQAAISRIVTLPSSPQLVAAVD